MAMSSTRTWERGMQSSLGEERLSDLVITEVRFYFLQGFGLQDFDFGKVIYILKIAVLLAVAYNGFGQALTNIGMFLQVFYRGFVDSDALLGVFDDESLLF